MGAPSARPGAFVNHRRFRMDSRLEVKMSPEKEEVIKWAGMLNQRLAIRSVLELGVHKSHFKTEITCATDEAGDSSGRIFRLELERFLGSSSEMPVTRLRELDESIVGLLTNMWDRIPIRNRKIADLFLEPRPHVAVVRSRLIDDFVLSPSHPLLTPYYGMVYELISTQKKTCKRDLSIPWGILRHRFGAFLYQQEEEVIDRTFGELLLSEF